jgi:hypothetical protein
MPGSARLVEGVSFCGDRDERCSASHREEWRGPAIQAVTSLQVVIGQVYAARRDVSVEPQVVAQDSGAHALHEIAPWSNRVQEPECRRIVRKVA